MTPRSTGRSVAASRSPRRQGRAARARLRARRAPATPWGVRLVLNRPAKLNALSGELVDALSAAVDGTASDPDVRVVVIEGAGRAFSSGYDLTDEAEGESPGQSAGANCWLPTSPRRSRSSTARNR
ncbi:MAG: enoyl-CoA hydratase/isomerase family protein [Candidatus Limnocylindrales bacterium]